MNRKLNYIFSQVLDNYKAAYKDNTAFYIAFGVLFVCINVIVYVCINAFGFLLFNQDPQHNTVYLVYSYLLLLTLPCLITLRKAEEAEPLKFWKAFKQNAKMLMLLGGLATIGFFFIGYCRDLFYSDLWNSSNQLLGILGNLLTVFILLSLLRLVFRKQIPFLDRLVETVILTVVLFAIISEFQSFFAYGFLESFQFIFGTDFGEIVLTPILFVLVNLLLSPLLVSIITTTIRYEKVEERVIETTANEEL